MRQGTEFHLTEDILPVTAKSGMLSFAVTTDRRVADMCDAAGMIEFNEADCVAMRGHGESEFAVTICIVFSL